MMAQTPTLVKDIKTGAVGCFERLNGSSSTYSESAFVKVWEDNGFIYFTATNYSSSSQENVELWKSDGTPGGTSMVKDINPGNAGSYPRYFYPFNGELFFVADNGTSGPELWKTDGSSAGTVLLKEIRSGTRGGFEYQSGSTTYSDIAFTVVATLGNQFMFTAINNSTYSGGIATNNRELWISDGTTAGTTLVKDIWSGVEGSYPDGFYTFNGAVYFAANDGTNGNELWKTDGTNAGTVLLKSIRSGARGGFEYQTGSTSYSDIAFDVVATLGNQFMFTAINNSSYTGGIATNNRELWISDGTTGGTTLVKDIWSGVEGSYPDGFYTFNGAVYFAANDGTNGNELWKTDGTNAGTVLLKSIRSGARGGFEYQTGSTSYSDIAFDVVATLGSQFMFTAINNSTYSGGVATNNRELWISDGTTAGTTLVKDIWSGVEGSYPDGFYTFNGAVYFAANDGTNGNELWKTDGTNAGTILLKSIRSGARGGFEYQTGSTSYSDIAFDVVATLGNQFMFTAINNSSYTGGIASNNRELWISDGTTAGTTLVKDIWSGVEGSYPDDFYTFNGAVYFAANDGTNGNELWKTDGTNAGTVLVKSIRGGAVGGFEYQSGSTTYDNINFTPVATSGSAFYFVAINNSVYTGGVATNNRELWKSDGTTAGTVLVEDLYSGVTGSYPKYFTMGLNKLFFSANHPSYGIELWVLDGFNTNITLLEPEYNWTVSPNPASNFCQVDLREINADINSIRLIDLQGRILQELPYNTSGVTELDLGQLGNGLYFVQPISHSTDIKPKKIIVQR
jgi:ELWxxDGT repeat protein